MNTFEKIQKLLAEQLNIDEAMIKPESDIIADLGADSLDVFEMLMTLEEEFEITVPDEQAKDMKTVGDITKFIESEIQ